MQDIEMDVSALRIITSSASFQNALWAAATYSNILMEKDDRQRNYERLSLEHSMMTAAMEVGLWDAS